MKNTRLIFVPTLLALMGWFVGGISRVEAAVVGYAAQVVSLEPSAITVDQGGVQAVRVRLKNTGTNTWVRDGKGWASLYTYDPKYHVSPLRGSSWLSDHQTGELLETKVAPGQMGTVEFFVYGPKGFSGRLEETFQLAAEDMAWMAGSKFVLPVSVSAKVAAPVSTSTQKSAPVSTPASAEDDTVAPVSGDEEADGYGSLLLLRSARTVVAPANQEVAVRLGFKNIGTKPWHSYELRESNLTLATADQTAVSYRAASWPQERVAVVASGKTVSPGLLEFIDLTVRVPHAEGKYEARFQLVTDGVLVPDSEILLPVEVTSTANEVINTPVVSPDQGPIHQGTPMEEPRIRVGLAKVKNEMIFNANTEVILAVGDVLERKTTIPAKQPMRVAWNGEQYVFETGGNILLLGDYPRFFGNEGAQTIFTVTSLDDIRTWNTNLNDNQFRDTLELRHNSEGNTWLINELPMEYYLYGIDETSNYAPQEYHKALLTAARTYALYMWEHKTKYKGAFFDIKATTADQVYHGYGAEIRRPNVIKAVDATRGISVQYEGQTIVASYSARTDGRTRSWKEVWGKAVPYAVSVPVPCEKGQTKWGHGVGLSAGGAVCMAKDGKTFDQILTYFYTGVELVDRW